MIPRRIGNRAISLRLLQYIEYIIAMVAHILGKGLGIGTFQHDVYLRFSRLVVLHRNARLRERWIDIHQNDVAVTLCQTLEIIWQNTQHIIHRLILHKLLHRLLQHRLQRITQLTLPLWLRTHQHQLIRFARSIVSRLQITHSLTPHQHKHRHKHGEYRYQYSFHNVQY